MYTVNLSFNVSPEVLDFWKSWVKTDYIPDVMSSGNFSGFKILKLITQIQNFEHTYAVQFYFTKKSDIDEIESIFDFDFDFKVAMKFGEKVLLFRTLLQEIKEF